MAHKLLLADDSITIQKVVELVLAEEGFDIRATGNGEEALSAIASFRPDIVLADIEMPKMNGYQLCERIKADPATRDIPVLLLAGAFEPIDEELAKSVGAEDYIIKPFESQELISKINVVLTAGEVAAAAPAGEEAVEALEAIGSEEDLWAMEEIVAEPEVAEGLMAETPVEEASAGEAFVFAEEIEAEVEPERIVARGPVVEKAAERAAERVVERPAVSMPALELPSKEEIAGMLRHAVNESVSSALSSFDIKDSVLSSLTPSIKDSVEKVLWEVAPELVEKLLKEMLQGALSSLTKEVEKVIWETVPDLAESLISREIEKIKSEI